MAKRTSSTMTSPDLASNGYGNAKSYLKSRRNSARKAKQSEILNFLDASLEDVDDDNICITSFLSDGKMKKKNTDGKRTHNSKSKKKSSKKHTRKQRKAPKSSKTDQEKSVDSSIETVLQMLPGDVDIELNKPSHHDSNTTCTTVAMSCSFSTIDNGDGTAEQEEWEEEELSIYDNESQWTEEEVSVNEEFFEWTEEELSDDQEDDQSSILFLKSFEPEYLSHFRDSDWESSSSEGEDRTYTEKFWGGLDKRAENGTNAAEYTSEGSVVGSKHVIEDASDLPVGVQLCELHPNNKEKMPSCHDSWLIDDTAEEGTFEEIVWSSDEDEGGNGAREYHTKLEDILECSEEEEDSSSDDDSSCNANSQNVTKYQFEVPTIPVLDAWQQAQQKVSGLTATPSPLEVAPRTPKNVMMAILANAEMEFKLRVAASTSPLIVFSTAQ